MIEALEQILPVQALLPIATYVAAVFVLFAWPVATPTNI